MPLKGKGKKEIKKKYNWILRLMKKKEVKTSKIIVSKNYGINDRHWNATKTIVRYE